MNNDKPEDLGSKRARTRTNKNYVRGPEYIGVGENDISSSTNLTSGGGTTSTSLSSPAHHHPTHHQQDEDNQSYNSSSTTNRPKREQVGRACQRCAVSKRKCSGTFPCDRCVKLGRADTCVEVIVKRKHNFNNVSTTTTTTGGEGNVQNHDDMEESYPYPNESLSIVSPLSSSSLHSGGNNRNNHNNNNSNGNGRRKSFIIGGGTTTTMITPSMDHNPYTEQQGSTLHTAGSRTIGKRRQMSSALTQNDVHQMEGPMNSISTNENIMYHLPSSNVPFFSGPFNNLGLNTMVNAPMVPASSVYYNNNHPSSVILSTTTSGHHHHHPPPPVTINDTVTMHPSSSSTAMEFSNKPYVTTIFHPTMVPINNTNGNHQRSPSGENYNNVSLNSTNRQFLSPGWWSRTNSVDQFPVPSTLSPPVVENNVSSSSSVRLARNNGYMANNNSNSDTESITHQSMTAALANTHLHDGTNSPTKNMHNKKDNNDKKRLSDDDLLMGSSVELLLRLSGEKAESEVAELGKQLLQSGTGDTNSVQPYGNSSRNNNDNNNSGGKINVSPTMAQLISPSFTMQVINSPDNPCLEIAPGRFIRLRAPPDVKITAETDLPSLTPFPAVRLRFPDNPTVGTPEHIEANKEAVELFGIDPDALHLLPSHHSEILWMHPDEMPHRAAAIAAVREIQAPYLEWSGRYVQMYKKDIAMDKKQYIAPLTTQYGRVEGTSVHHKSTTSMAHETVPVPHYALFLAWERLFFSYYPSGALRTAMSLFTNVERIAQEISPITVESLRYQQSMMDHTAPSLVSSSSSSGFLSSSGAGTRLNNDTVIAASLHTQGNTAATNIYYPSPPPLPMNGTPTRTASLGFGFDVPVPSHSNSSNTTSMNMNNGTLYSHNGTSFVRGNRTSSDRMFRIGGNSMTYDYVSPNVYLTHNSGTDTMNTMNITGGVNGNYNNNNSSSSSSFIRTYSIPSVSNMMLPTISSYPNGNLMNNNSGSSSSNGNLRISSSSASQLFLSTHAGSIGIPNNNNSMNNTTVNPNDSTTMHHQTVGTLRNSLDYDIAPRESFSIMTNNNNNRLSSDTPTSYQSLNSQMRDNTIHSNRSSVDSLTAWNLSPRVVSSSSTSSSAPKRQ